MEKERGAASPRHLRCAPMTGRKGTSSPHAAATELGYGHLYPHYARVGTREGSRKGTSR